MGVQATSGPHAPTTLFVTTFREGERGCGSVLVVLFALWRIEARSLGSPFTIWPPMQSFRIGTSGPPPKPAQLVSFRLCRRSFGSVVGGSDRGKRRTEQTPVTSLTPNFPNNPLHMVNLDDERVEAPPLRPPLANTSSPSDKEPDDLEKIRKWQEERIARKLRGEYESSVMHLTELVRVPRIPNGVGVLMYSCVPRFRITLPLLYASRQCALKAQTIPGKPSSVQLSDTTWRTPIPTMNLLYNLYYSRLATSDIPCRRPTCFTT